jgi:nucleotide-binding universal stress UspA family protein
MAKPKVMVALCDPDSVECLLIVACQLADGMDADLTALHVVEVPLLTPLEATEEVLDHPGMELLARAQRVAEKFSMPLATHLVRAREVGEAIVGEAKEQGVELLVMGHHMPHPHMLSEALLGGHSPICGPPRAVPNHRPDPCAGRSDDQLRGDQVNRKLSAHYLLLTRSPFSRIRCTPSEFADRTSNHPINRFSFTRTRVEPITR